MSANSKHASTTVPRATRENEVWLVDHVLRDDDRRTRILIVFDVFSRLPVVLSAVDPAVGIAEQLIALLNEACGEMRRPAMIWVDAGYEFRSPELVEWTARYAINILYGAPMEKRSIVEPFLRQLGLFLRDSSSAKPDELKGDLEKWRQANSRRRLTSQPPLVGEAD
jgi:hypothetical protein